MSAHKVVSREEWLAARKQLLARERELAEKRATYNYGPLEEDMSDMPGVSTFARDSDGALFHTYSCYARGIDIVNGAYQYLDLVPKGRDEQGFSFSMEWLRRHDEYA